MRGCKGTVMNWCTLDDKTVSICCTSHEEQQDKQIGSEEKKRKKWQWMKRNMRDNDVFERDLHQKMKEIWNGVDECEYDEMVLMIDEEKQMKW